MLILTYTYFLKRGECLVQRGDTDAQLINSILHMLFSQQVSALLNISKTSVRFVLCFYFVFLFFSYLAHLATIK